MTLEQAIAQIQRCIDVLFERGQVACTPNEFQNLHQAWTIVQAATHGALPEDDA